MKTSICFYPAHSKKGFKSQKTPIYIRVCFMGKKSESRLNADLTQDQLAVWDPLTMRLRERNSPVNHYLNRIEQKFNDLLLQLGEDLVGLSAHDIKNQTLGTTKTKCPFVLDFVDKYFSGNVLNNVNRTPGTIKNYRRAINHLSSYLKANKLEKIQMDQFKVELANEFKNYLVNSDPAKQRVGMTEVSAAGVIKKFRTIFSQAVDEEIIKSNPFKKVKIRTKSPKRERLSLGQVNKIRQLDLSLHPYLVLYRDIFLFSVCTGLAYHDLSALKNGNLDVNSNGTIKLTINRQKTDVITECFLPNLAIEIMNKYKSLTNTKIGFEILPYRSNKEINSQLKVLATLSGITIRLTTHIARHTFRQLIAEAGVTDYGVIKRMMGQSRNGDVDEVYYSITERALLDAKKRLDELLELTL